MGPAGRGAALAAVADALDARAGELAALADRETALGLPRLTGEVARSTGQLRMFRDVLADGSYQDVITSPPGEGVPALSRMVHADRPGRGLRRVELPVSPSRSRAATPPPRSPRAARWWSRRMNATRRRRSLTGQIVPTRWPARARRPGRSRWCTACPPGWAAPASRDQRRRVHRLHPRRHRAGPDLRPAAGADPVLRRARLGQPGGHPARRGSGPGRRGRRRVTRPRSPSGWASSAPIPGCCSCPTTRRC